MIVKKHKITTEVNGKKVTAEVEPRLMLSDFLRQNLGLTGTHVGCEHGVCGACNVMLDGRSARSCLTYAVQVDGAKIETVESLGTIDKLHPLQIAFWEKHGLQCGFCTPGMLISAKELLEKNPNPTRAEIIDHISGNLCRCTGYQNIVDSIAHAAELIAAERAKSFAK
jgi:aerobic carbon-monoxide dehydrogenase small subunit